MAVAVRRQFHETARDIASKPVDGQKSIDREKCILYGVRVLGLESDNGRVYLREAVAKAIAAGLYERTSVRMNHPDPDSKADKPVEDINGWLFDVRATEDGARGNWQLNPQHPMTPRIMWAAENNPAQYGLSHNVGAVGEPKDGKFVITEIVSVTSVDLVSDPATVRGLFESKGKQAVKLRKRILLEGLRAKLTKWRPKAPKLARRLCEAMDDAMGDGETSSDMEADEPGKMAPADHLKKGVYEACHSVIESDDMDADGKSAAIKKMLKMHEKMNATEADDEKDDDAEKDTADKPNPETESRNRELTQLRAEKAVRVLCESLNFQPSATMLETLAYVPTDELRKKLIAEAIKASGTARPRSGNTQESYRPDSGRDQGQGGGVIDTSKITKTEDFTSILRGA